MPDGLLKTVTDLAKGGYAGVGIIVFLLLFILLLRGKPADAASARLHNRFLTWGVSFAVFSGLLSVLTQFMTPKPVVAGPQKLLMTFAPDFDTEKLPSPRIKLADGRTVGPDQEFVSPGGMINISVGDALNEVRSLKATVGEYGKTIAELLEQRDALAKKVASASPATSDVGLAEASAASSAVQAQVKSAMANGDFTGAARFSRQLNNPTLIAPSAITRMTRLPDR